MPALKRGAAWAEERLLGALWGDREQLGTPSNCGKRLSLEFLAFWRPSEARDSQVQEGDEIRVWGTHGNKTALNESAQTKGTKFHQPLTLPKQISSIF